jgi:hypothetical protein
MYNIVFIGRDSLIRGKDKIGDVKYWGNDWWSIESKFNIDGIKDINDWSVKTGLEQRNGKIIGMSIKPDFINPGHAAVTSASQLKNFNNYRLSNSSVLRKKSVYADRHGIKNIKL